MRGYEYETNDYHQAIEDEYEDEYYDEDEYEEEGSGAVEEHVEEEPPEGQKEILELRERLKEQIRRKAKAAGASTAGRLSSSHDRVPPTRYKFGSFFGPSKPVISQRVIEERKSLKELHSTIARDPRPSGRDIPSSSKVQSKGNGPQHKPKIVNEAKKKAVALKDNRDYSFLLSDDADLPSSPKEKPAARSSLTQKADREVMHSALKSKASTSQPARLSNGYGSKTTLSSHRHAEAKVDSMRKEALSNRERAISRDKERMHSIGRNGSNQANASKTTCQKLPSRGLIADKHPSKDVNDPSLRKSSVPSRHHLSESARPQSSQSQRMQLAGQRPQHSSHGKKPHQSVQQRPQQSLQSRKPQQVSQGQRLQQLLQSQRAQQAVQSQRLHQSSAVQKLQSSQTHRSQSQSYRPQPSQGQKSSQGQYSEQRRVQSNDRVKQVERQIRPPSRPMPSCQISSNGIRDDHAKKKQGVKRRFDEDEDEDDPLAMIRSMFRYDPSKYAGRDDDDSDMEADFATIEREEKRSARIARQEDEEQLRLIEEEERREQERKRRKMARGR